MKLLIVIIILKYYAISFIYLKQIISIYNISNISQQNLSTFLTRNLTINKVIKSLPQQKSLVILKIRPNLILDAVHKQTRSSRTTKKKHQKRPFFIIAHMFNSIKTAKKIFESRPKRYIIRRNIPDQWFSCLI
jgi:hypothetical protein